MQTTEDLLAGDVRGKRVLVRSDLNVPLDADRNITDDGRVRASVPTIKALSDAGAKVIVVATTVRLVRRTKANQRTKAPKSRTKWTTKRTKTNGANELSVMSATTSAMIVMSVAIIATAMNAETAQNNA